MSDLEEDLDDDGDVSGSSRCWRKLHNRTISNTCWSFPSWCPALRRSGRFDAEIEVTTPTEVERFQILKLYTKKVPLDPNVDLQAIAAACNGYVGADLEALCREAAMSAFRRSSVP